MGKLIYQAGFESDALEPAGGDGAETLGALRLTQPPDVPGPATQLIMWASPPRAEFALTRAKDFPVNNDRENCYFGAVVDAFPRSIDYFKIRATFEMPQWVGGTTTMDYGWAAVIFYRKDNSEDWPFPGERATVTFRSGSAGGVRTARLNMPGATDVLGGKPPPVPTDLYAGIYESGDRQRSTFTLELLVDRNWLGIARARLEARVYERSEAPNPLMSPLRLPTWSSHVEYRWFTHPLITEDLTEEPGMTTDSVGFALSIASASDEGTAMITISDFCVYRLTILEVAWLRFREVIIKAGDIFSGR